eukprot:COSAG01_NODE_10512_length_2148_cov_1.187408_4_plen_202_part_00
MYLYYTYFCCAHSLIVCPASKRGVPVDEHHQRDYESSSTKKARNVTLSVPSFALRLVFLCWLRTQEKCLQKNQVAHSNRRHNPAKIARERSVQSALCASCPPFRAESSRSTQCSPGNRWHSSPAPETASLARHHRSVRKCMLAPQRTTNTFRGERASGLGRGPSQPTCTYTSTSETRPDWSAFSTGSLSSPSHKLPSGVIS